MYSCNMQLYGDIYVNMHCGYVVMHVTLFCVALGFSYATAMMH